MKKGFTLIELLAVIVILAIIALIATPIVLNIINDTKESATLRSAEMYLDAVEMSVAQAITKNKTISNTPYKIKDGDICLNEACTDKLEVEASGEVPKEGTITITNGTITQLNIILNKKEITKNSKNEMVYVKFLDEVCEHISGIQKTIGAKYECDFGGGVRKFYILELGSNPVTGSTLKSDEVALILEGNYDTTTHAWCDQKGANPSNNVCKVDGLTKKLDNISEAWYKLERSQIGIPSATQIVVADGKNENEYTNYAKLTSAWLYNWPDNANYKDEAPSPYGYWTSSPRDGQAEQAWYVGRGGGFHSDSINRSGGYGVRPVINLRI